jgi:hypothetical protein
MKVENGGAGRRNPAGSAVIPFSAHRLEMGKCTKIYYCFL